VVSEDGSCYCQNCQPGRFLFLHDNDRTPVELDGCPWAKYDFTQERYIKDVYNHYRNGHLVYHLSEMPQWLRDGIDCLAMIDAVEQDDERKKQEAATRQQKLRNMRR